MEKKKPYNPVTILWAFFPMIFLWTPLSTPIHEMGHYLVGLMVGGHPQFVKFNMVQASVPDFFEPMFSAMGNGIFIVITLLLYKIFRTVSFKTLFISMTIWAPIDFLTLTDSDFPGAKGFMFFLAITAMLIGLRPFKNIHELRNSKTGQVQKKVVNYR